MIPVPYLFPRPEKPLGPAALEAWMADVEAVIPDKDDSGRLTVFVLLDREGGRLTLSLEYNEDGNLVTKGFFARGVAVTHVRGRDGKEGWAATGGFPPDDGGRASGLYLISLPRNVRRILEGPWRDAGVQQRLLAWKPAHAA